MGIIKLIGKVFSWSTDTILPEAVMVIGVGAQLMATALAYDAESTEKVEAYDSDNNRIPEEDTVAKKVNPVDVYCDLLPDDNGWHIRKAIEDYNALDRRGRSVFFFQTVAFACGGYYGIANLMRLKRAIVAKNMMKYDLECAQAESSYLLDKTKETGQEALRIVKWYDENGYTRGIKGDTDEHFNYDNMLTLSNQCANRLKAIKDFRVQYNYKGGEI